MPLDYFLAEEIIDSPYIKHNLKSSISKRAQAAGFKKFSLNNNDLTDVGLKIGAKNHSKPYAIDPDTAYK